MKGFYYKFFIEIGESCLEKIIKKEHQILDALFGLLFFIRPRERMTSSNFISCGSGIYFFTLVYLHKSQSSSLLSASQSFDFIIKHSPSSSQPIVVEPFVFTISN